MQVTYPASLPETPRFPSPPPMAPFSSATATGKGYQHRWVADFGRILLNFETRRNGPMATVAFETAGLTSPWEPPRELECLHLYTMPRGSRSSTTLYEDPLLVPRPGGGAGHAE